MRTDELVDLLASDVVAVRTGLPPRRLALASAMAAGGALAVLLAWLGPRPDLHLAMRTAAFWMKAGYTLCAAAAGFVLTARLARPGGAAGRTPRITLLAAGAGIVALAALDLALAPAGRRVADWMGTSAMVCPWRILAISAPAFLAIIWGLRGLAPTRLALAGGAAGVLAGGIGATIYGLYCQETTAMFVATWYTLGLAACAGVGALLGPRLLRW